MNTRVPTKGECDTFELEGLGVLRNLWQAFNCQPPFTPSYGPRGATGYVLDCGKKPGNLHENHKRRTCERRIGPGWNQTHNLPALRPLKHKQRKQSSDWLVLFYVLYFFLKCCFVVELGCLYWVCTGPKHCLCIRLPHFPDRRNHSVLWCAATEKLDNLSELRN